MPFGIRPTVDFAFKMIFGSPDNASALIGLLNAVLRRTNPIAAVEILNPFTYQEFEGSKPIVLDIRFRDSAGRWLNVEMQLTRHAGFVQRLVYYACSMCRDQLSAGSNYALLSPAISIGLIGEVLFSGTAQ